MQSCFSIDDPNSRALKFPRLEYGKLTDGHGVAEIMEHTELARSEEFPEHLRQYCGPRLLGPCRLEGEQLPEFALHGTVLQPVAAGRQVTQVFVRVTGVPEIRTHRNYQRARFLVSTYPASPRALMEAMNRTPMGEFSKHSQPDTVAALSAVPPAPSLPDPRFLNPALAYILASVPIAIEGVDEAVFFDLVESIWLRFPPALRPWISAGWGVGPSLCGELAVYAGANASESSARYNARAGTWSVPERCAESPEAERQAYINRRLAHDFVKHLYEDDPARTLKPALAGLVDALLGAPKVQHDGIIEWQSPQVREAMLQVSRAGADAWRLEQMRCALRTGKRSDLDPELFLRNIWLDTAPEIGLHLVLDAMAEPDTEGPAAWAFGRWLECSGKSAEAMAAQSTGKVLERTQSFQSLRRQPAAAVLTRLIEGSRLEEREPWNREALIAGLRDDARSLRTETLQLHARLLQLAQPPGIYRDFLRSCAWDLALGIDGLRPFESGALLALMAGMEPNSMALSLLCRLASGESPPPGAAAAVAKNEPLAMPGLVKRILGRWEDMLRYEACHRDVLLDWALAFVEPGRLPVADLARPNDSQEAIPPLRAVLSEVAAGRVPPRAAPLVAALVESRMEGCLPSILGKRDVWAPIAQFWPAGLRRFLDLDTVPGRLPPSFARFYAGSIEVLVRYWCEKAVAGLPVYDVVPDMIELSSSIGDTRRCEAPVASLCAALRRERFRYFVSGGPEAETAERVAALYRMLPDADRYSIVNYAPQTAWDAAEHQGALLLLLLLFPEFDFKPDRADLVRLSRESTRPALRRHIAREGVAAERLGRFSLAAAGFHEYEYDEQRFPGSDTVLWAVFRGVPLELQGPLSDALNHYASTRKNSVPLCVQYLDGMCGICERRAAAERVMSNFIEPLLADGLDGEKMAGRFLNSVRQIEGGMGGPTIPIVARDTLGAYRLADYSRVMNQFEADIGFLRLVQRVLRCQNEQRRTFFGR